MEEQQHAIKAEERRSRMSHMLASSSSPLEVGTAAPPELSDLEMKASIRQPRVARLLQSQPIAHDAEASVGVPTPATSSSMNKSSPREFHDLGIKMQVRQEHMTRVHQQQVMGVPKYTSNAASRNIKSLPLTDLEERKATTGQRGTGVLHHMKPKVTAPLLHSSAGAPSAIPADTDAALHAKQQGQRQPSDLEEASTMMNLPGAYSHLEQKSDKEITAILVHDDDREQILQEARAELLSAAVLASVMDDSKKNAHRRQQQWTGIGLVCCMFLVGASAIIGGVCGTTGVCGGESPSVERADTAERVVQVTDLIQSVSLNSEALLVNGGVRNSIFVGEAEEALTSPEFEALSFVLKTDLSPEENAPQLVQRYALAVLWFATGPWSLSDRKQAVNANPQQTWFVDSNECRWEGVTCNGNGVATNIHLSHQNMRGSLPVDLALLTELTSLSVPNNALSGPIPSFLTRLSDLAHLDLSGNSFTGPILPSLFTAFPALTAFLASSNEFTGTFPSVESVGPQIQKLAVDFNSLTGTLPNSLSDWTYLTHLGMAGNQLTGTLPDLELLTDLNHLTVGLRGKSFGGLLPLAGLHKLTHLSVDATSMEGSSLPETIGEWWPELQLFSIVRADLEGSIPESIEQWTNMKHFSLGTNQLTGRVPEEIYTTWSNLESLTLSWNDLRDTIPSEIGTLAELKMFDIRHNRFTGTLPTTIGYLTNLEGLVLTSNRLSGEIPTEVLNIPDEGPWFDSNRFEGTAPYCVDDFDTIIAVRVDCEAVECPCCNGC